MSFGWMKTKSSDPGLKSGELLPFENAVRRIVSVKKVDTEKDLSKMFRVRKVAKKSAPE